MGHRTPFWPGFRTFETAKSDFRFVFRPPLVVLFASAPETLDDSTIDLCVLVVVQTSLFASIASWCIEALLRDIQSLRKKGGEGACFIIHKGRWSWLRHGWYARSRMIAI